jgi:hypothetical protein
MLSIVILIDYITTTTTVGRCLFPTSSPTFVVGGVLGGSYSNRSEIES